MKLRALAPYLVRVAGFSYERLLPLRCDDRTRVLALQLDDARSARIRAGTAVDTALAAETFPVTDTFDKAARKQLVRAVQRLRAAATELADAELPDAAAVIEAVPALPFAELAHAHAAWRDAKAALEHQLAAELDRTRGELRRLFAEDERLQESVFLESEEAYVGVRQLLANEPGPRNSRTRQRERVAMMYAQRFCAKNDTNSICGPIGLASLAESTGAAEIAITQEDLQRETYVSHWAAEALLRAALDRAGDAAPSQWRLQPSARLDDTTVSWCAMTHDATTTFRRTYARSQLPAAGVELVRALAVPRDRQALQQIGADHGLEPDEVSDFVGELVEAGVIEQLPRIPPGLFRPLRYLADLLEAWPASDARTWALGEVHAIEQLVARFAKAPLAERTQLSRTLSERFVAATGNQATRGRGQHYADRGLLHEDASIATRSSLGPALPALERSLPSVLAVCELPLELARERVREWFGAKFGTRRIPALEAHRAFDTDRVLETPAASPRSHDLRRAIDRVRELIERSPATDGVLQLTSTALDEAIACAAAPTHPGYVSIDVMLRALPDGQVELVLGEVHGFYWLPTSFLDILPAADRDRVLEQMRAAIVELAGPTPTAESLFLHTQATDRRFPLASHDLELVVRSPRETAFALGELDMELVDGTFHFYSGDREIIPLVAYTKYPFFLYTSRIAPLFDDFAQRFFPTMLLPAAMQSGDAPRLAVDSIVVQRREWRRPAGYLRTLLVDRSEAELFCGALALQQELGASTTVFVSIPGEPKPLLLEFANLFLIEAIAKAISTLADETLVKLSEMLPAGDELLARGPDGVRTSELRMGFYRV